jgi:hypothetical protein
LHRSLHPGVSHEDVVYFDVETLAAYPVQPITNVDVHAQPITDVHVHVDNKTRDSNTSTSTTTTSTAPWRLGRKPRVTKRVTREGQGWENPRPPFDVAVEVTASVAPRLQLADADAAVEVAPGAEFSAKRTVWYRSGDGSLPAELAAAVDSMRVGEEATVWCEPGPHLLQGSHLLLPHARLHLPPAPPAAAEDGLQYVARLVSMVHVRDVL